MLGMDEFEWREKEISNRKLQNVRPLFERIDVTRIDDELAQLLVQSRDQQNKLKYSGYVFHIAILNLKIVFA